MIPAGPLGGGTQDDGVEAAPHRILGQLWEDPDYVLPGADEQRLFPWRQLYLVDAANISKLNPLLPILLCELAHRRVELLVVAAQGVHSQWGRLLADGRCWLGGRTASP